MTESQHSNDRFDEYIDGQMDAAEREQFERELQASESLRRELDMQRQIDRSLKALFTEASSAAAPNAAVAGQGVQEGSAPAAMWFISRRHLAAAAAVAIIVVGAWAAWLLWGSGPGRPTYDPGPWRTFAQAFHEIEQPQWECTPAEFRETFITQFGHELEFPDLPEGVELMGLGYCNTLTSGTTWILARRDEEKFIVFVDRVERDSSLPRSESTAVHVFRQTRGPLVLYEVSEQDEPVLLPAIQERR